ncbi:hypothetical protein FGIG_03512 [Fasciola gigantica]|uniref:Uncharacterized protein n=1 Tax=Fasciola gigantica TaxID=46835 RepID=A0A504YZ79_FASGI|nr:hypothetical protein FGIG_03512 [Fasciola gigantica]
MMNILNDGCKFKPNPAPDNVQLIEKQITHESQILMLHGVITELQLKKLEPARVRNGGAAKRACGCGRRALAGGGAEYIGGVGTRLIRRGSGQKEEGWEGERCAGGTGGGGERLDMAPNIECARNSGGGGT